MKRILVMVIFAVAVIGGINVFNAQESEPLSDIALANVEALEKVRLQEWVVMMYWRI